MDPRSPDDDLLHLSFPLQRINRKSGTCKERKGFHGITDDRLLRPWMPRRHFHRSPKNTWQTIEDSYNFVRVYFIKLNSFYTIFQITKLNSFYTKLDKVVKSPYFSNLSFLRKQESSYFNGFWTPAFAGVTDFGLFTRPSSFRFMKVESEVADHG